MTIRQLPNINTLVEINISISIVVIVVYTLASLVTVEIAIVI
jgi:hypothetical protein